MRETIDGVNGPEKASTNLECVLEKMNKTTLTVKLGDTYAEMKDKMLESLAKFRRNGSGWRLKEIVGLYINMVRFDPIEGSGYSELPAFVTSIIRQI